MDAQTLIILVLAGLLLVELLVIAGLVLTARSYTQLSELIHSLALIATMREADFREGLSEQRRDLLDRAPDSVVQQWPEKRPPEPPPPRP